MIGQLSQVTYATWNPADKAAGVTLSNGNLTAASSLGAVRATFGKSSGKWYWEVLTQAVGGDIGIANGTSTIASYCGQQANQWGYDNDGKIYSGGTGGAYGATYTNGARIGIALDLDGGTCTWYKNGVSQGAKTISFGGAVIYPCVGSGTSGKQWTANFGASAFTYSVPSGYSPGFYK
jgi:hypothetical protein